MIALNSKQWIKRLLLTTLVVIVLPVSILMGFNFYIDPLWNFSHQNKYNDHQIGFDERQQKTNYINSKSNFNYDSLMIGTSRVTYMSEKAFQKEKVFNYSLSALHIDEYLPYINYATKKNGNDFKTIYIELYVNSYDAGTKMSNQDPSVYIKKSEDPFYKITSLFSYSTLKSSIDNYNASKSNYYSGPRSYTRENIAQTSYPNDRLDVLWNRFEQSFKATSQSKFNYDSGYKQKLLQIKNAYPNTKFVVFTDPVPEKRFDLILSNTEHRKAYERYIREIVDVFGEVYSFQGNTPITTDMDNYFDWFHYYPKVGNLMIQAIEQPNKHEDILQIINKENVNDYLQKLTSHINI